MSSEFETIDPSLLVATTGGQAAAPQQEQFEDGPAPQRGLRQIAREYAGACVSGAGQAMLFGGRPRNWRDAATTAGIGCAMGVGGRAIEDAAGWISGEGR